MKDNQENIEHLLKSLEILQKRQEMFSKEILHLRSEVSRFKAAEFKKAQQGPAVQEEVLSPADLVVEANSVYQDDLPAENPKWTENRTAEENSDSSEEHSSMEKFIGENLINKIGIAITIIGVSIGVKYSIDHNLITPLFRILLGYLAGFILLGVGLRLRTQYEKYSAVLVSGSMAILYFITYAAFSFYSLIPQLAAFAILITITIYTVWLALKYDSQVIALIGLAGAYAIPFLLGDDKSRVVVLFSYVAIINIGILVVAIQKYWEPLYYVSFLLSWLIYYTWFDASYNQTEYFGVAIFYLAVNFALFYTAFLSYKVRKNQAFVIPDILLLLANSFFFFGIGYLILKDHPTREWSLGLFTMINAAIHFLVGMLIYRKDLSDKNLFRFILGLVVVFITIAVPVQLDGNGIALFWSVEAVLLFLIGRKSSNKVYEFLSYPLMILAFLSLIHLWREGYFYGDLKDITNGMLPLTNSCFIASLVVTASFGLILVIENNDNYHSSLDEEGEIRTLVSFLIPLGFLLLLFFSFRNELALYWDHRYKDSLVKITNSSGEVTSYLYNVDLKNFKTVWLGNYALLFFTLLSFANIRKLRNQLLGYINLVINVLVILLFLAQGLFLVGMLRDSYLNPSLTTQFNPGTMNIAIRYISLVFLAAILYASYLYTRAGFLETDLRKHFDLVLHVSVLWYASSELTGWMEMAGSAQSYKLGLSILWGVYSLLLISFGIWKKMKHLRIGAITLFSLTLLKLFFYDLKDLDTIAKTIVFVSLGVLLLIISFLYNKYKNIISD